MRENNNDVLGKNFVLPRDSRCFLNRCTVGTEYINLYLAQNRFCKKDESKSKYGSWLKKGVSEQSMDLYAEYPEVLSLASKLNKRNETLAGGFGHGLNYRFELNDKLILGEGGSAYINVQPLRLHPLYGLPFIPASVLKGTLRNVWISERFGGDEGKAEKNKDFIYLFGGQKEDTVRWEGKLCFFDCFPERCEIGLDVQTVHYKSYYGRGRYPEPTDDQSTLPVFFMCLKEAVFSIFITFCDKNEEPWLRLKNEIESMVNCMFSMYGIGAKTALGYGVGACTAL